MQMGLDMVYAEQRNAERFGEPFRGVEPDYQRRRQAWTVGHRDCIDLLDQRGPHHLGNLFDMGARSDFRHDAAIRYMQRNLRIDDIRDDSAAILHYRRGGFVATGLDSENLHRLTRTSTKGFSSA